MSAEESEQFVRLLYRYAESELDQWDNWRLDTEIGPVYVSMSRGVAAGLVYWAFSTLPRSRGHDGKPAGSHMPAVWAASDRTLKG